MQLLGEITQQSRMEAAARRSKSPRIRVRAAGDSGRRQQVPAWEKPSAHKPLLSFSASDLKLLIKVTEVKSELMNLKFGIKAFFVAAVFFLSLISFSKMKENLFSLFL